MESNFQEPKKQNVYYLSQVQSRFHTEVLGTLMRPLKWKMQKPQYQYKFIKILFQNFYTQP
jgi:hypothetical protein